MQYSWFKHILLISQQVTKFVHQDLHVQYSAIQHWHVCTVVNLYEYNMLRPTQHSKLQDVFHQPNISGIHLQPVSQLLHLDDIWCYRKISIPKGHKHMKYMYYSQNHSTERRKWRLLQWKSRWLKIANNSSCYVVWKSIRIYIL